MTFEEVLDQAIEMLRRRGRVTYRALQRQFGLDDAYLADLKAEIIEAQRLAVDENGTVLVWTGGAGAAVIPLSAQPEPLRATQTNETAPVAPTPIAPGSSDAERRQLTVMFCDLMDSTALSSRLDPEDLREVVRAYQTMCEEVIQRYGGHIAQYLGDGLLVYFGYPQAHEDDAQRAIRTGLGITEAISMLNTPLEQEWGVRLTVRVGMHTGLVVVGEMGSGDRREQLALGETPNIAAKLQGLAAPETVVISALTYRLTQGYFVCQDLGPHTIRPNTAPLYIYRVIEEREAQSRWDIAVRAGLTPLVGRQEEISLLRRRWEQSKTGLGQVVLLRGESTGNSAVLLHAIAKDPAMLVWLDNAGSRREAPNENFAREVMELFTLGEGRYGERDVKEAARAFTGFSLDRDTGETVWARQFPTGSHLGGIMTTAAYHDGALYLSSNQWTNLVDFHATGNRSTTFAVDAATGDILWQRPLPSPTFGAMTYANGVVIQPTVAGTVHALDAATGAVLWSDAPGGDLGGGISVVDGKVFVPHGFWFFAASANPAGGLVAYGLD